MIYVDRLHEANWRYKRSCHLFSDTSNRELHPFARQLDLHQRHFQNKLKFPHYDLSPTKQKLALRYGAKLVSRKEGVHIMRNRFNLHK